MKIRLLTSLLFVAACLSAHCQTSSTDSVICVVERDVAEAQVHIRAEGQLWSLLWDYTDENNYRCATIKMLSTSAGEDIYKYAGQVTIERIVDGKTVCSNATEVAHSTRKASIKLSVKDGNVRILAGDGTRCFANKDAMQFIGKAGSKIIFRQQKPTKQATIYKTIGYREAAEFAEVDDTAQLDEYLSASTDSIEGYWQYLDRDVDAPNTIVGGFYTLATVRHGNSYDIIYLDGADKYSNLWTPLQVKGHLHSTIFRDNFDLDWTDSQRTQTFNKDVYVTFEQNSIMTLHFPLLKSEVRFSRKRR